MEETPVLIVSGEYRYACRVLTKGLRLAEVLNSSHTSYLSIENVAMFHRSTPDCRGRVPDGIMSKSKIEVVAIASRQHEASRMRAFRRVEKCPNSVVVTTPGSQVEGTAHVSGSHDPTSFLAVEASLFFPITNALVHNLSENGVPIEADVALVNKSLMAHITIGSNINFSTPETCAVE